MGGGYDKEAEKDGIPVDNKWYVLYQRCGDGE